MLTTDIGRCHNEREKCDSDRDKSWSESHLFFQMSVICILQVSVNQGGIGAEDLMSGTV